MKDNKKFFWGASTAAHQVEGGLQNQWSVWELANASHQAKTAKQRLGWLKNWDEIKHLAEDPNNYVSGRGVDHYNTYKEDFDILQKLGLNSFRFTIEWSRLEPKEGTWDKEEFEHYRQYIAELNKRGVEPFLNIWHWTVPVWFEEKGGFAKRGNIKYFERLTQKINEELLNKVNYVITLNEPNVYASFSFGTGEWPPQEKSWLKMIWVYNNLKIAHKKAYKIIKKTHPKISVGIAQQLADIQPFRPGNWLDEVCVKTMRYAWNWWFLNRIKNQQDFVGVNYYFTDYYKGWNRQNPQIPINDLGWYMNAAGILPLLQRIAYHNPGKPIIITENGVADMNDKYRKGWLAETMEAIETAKSLGLPVVGYLHWSLLDNFEWAYGWWPKFGLVGVDRKTMKRTIRPSAIWWSKYISNRYMHKN